MSDSGREVICRSAPYTTPAGACRWMWCRSLSARSREITGMWQRLALRVGPGLAVVPFISTRVHAAEVKQDSVDPTPDVKRLKVSELPLYGEPEEPELEYIPEDDTTYTSTVSSMRKTLWTTADSMQATTDKIKYGYGVAKQYSHDFKKNIQEDTGVLKRAGLITVAGLGGVVAGYKGGFLRKAAFASVAMGTTAAICYPNQAVDMSEASWNRVKNQAKDLWEGGTGSNKVEIKKDTSISQKVEEDKMTQPSSQKHKTTTVEKGSSMKTDPSKEDHGMSKSEDKDMYTTRS